MDNTSADSFSNPLSTDNSETSPITEIKTEPPEEALMDMEPAIEVQEQDPMDTLIDVCNTHIQLRFHYAEIQDVVHQKLYGYNLAMNSLFTFELGDPENNIADVPSSYTKKIQNYNQILMSMKRVYIAQCTTLAQILAYSFSPHIPHHVYPPTPTGALTFSKQHTAYTQSMGAQCTLAAEVNYYYRLVTSYLGAYFLTVQTILPSEAAQHVNGLIKDNAILKQRVAKKQALLDSLIHTTNRVNQIFCKRLGEKVFSSAANGISPPACENLPGFQQHKTQFEQPDFMLNTSQPSSAPTSPASASPIPLNLNSTYPPAAPSSPPSIFKKFK